MRSAKACGLRRQLLGGRGHLAGGRGVLLGHLIELLHGGGRSLRHAVEFAHGADILLRHFLELLHRERGLLGDLVELLDRLVDLLGARVARGRPRRSRPSSEVRAMSGTSCCSIWPASSAIFSVVPDSSPISVAATCCARRACAPRRRRPRSLAVLAGARRLDRRVQRQEVGLAGDLLHDADLVGDGAHRLDRVGDRLTALLGADRGLRRDLLGGRGVLRVSDGCWPPSPPSPTRPVRSPRPARSPLARGARSKWPVRPRLAQLFGVAACRPHRPRCCVAAACSAAPWPSCSAVAAD